MMKSLIMFLMMVCTISGHRTNSTTTDTAVGESSGASSLQVITFNVGAGASRRFGPRLMSVTAAQERIPSLVARSLVNGPAVICLQEVDSLRPRSGDFQLADWIARLNADDDGHWQGSYQPLVSADGGSTGIAILMRDVDDAEPEFISTYQGAENRAAQALRIQLDGQPLWIVNTHVGFSNQAGQLQTLIEALVSRAGDEPIVVCGDFNIADPRVSAEPAIADSFDQLFETWHAEGFVPAMFDPEPTVPAWAGDRGGFKLDYLWLRSCGVLEAVNSTTITPEVGGQFLSDHRVLKATFQMKNRH